MILNGIELFKEFSWETAAEKYLHVLFKIQTTAHEKPARHHKQQLR
jgi:hypothetical protein